MNRRIREKKAKQLREHATREITSVSVLRRASERSPAPAHLVERVMARALQREVEAAQDSLVADSLTQRRRHG